VARMGPIDRRQWWTPTTAHLLSLAVGVAVIVVLARDQWFFGDDWAILAPHRDGELMQPHVGHWNLVPAVVFPALRDAVGLGSYLPYLALALAAHVAVVHLSWRVLRRVGVNPWLATGLAAVLLVLGGGAENILWAFQFGFLGAIALGLCVLLLLDRSRPVIWLVAPLSVLAPMFSGTAIPLLAAAAVLGWIRRGFWRTALLLLPAAVVYLTWYLVVARSVPPSGQGAQGPGDVGPALLYAATMVAGGLGRALPFIGLGVIPAIAVAVWVVLALRGGELRTRVAPALALAAGELVFIGLTAFSRLGNGLSSAASERYAYATIVMLVPVIGLLLHGVVQRWPRLRWAVVAVVLALAVTNGVTLALEAGQQAEREAGSRARIADTLRLLHAEPDNAVALLEPADPIWAPDLLGSDLLRLERQGLRP
jgi:hypothetical protein